MKRTPVVANLLGRVRTPFLLGTFGFGLVMLFVWQQAEVDRLLVSLELEERRQGELETAVNTLRYEVESLASHGQVTDQAVRRLHMIRPSRHQIHRLQFDDVAAGGSMTPWVDDALAETRP